MTLIMHSDPNCTVARIGETLRKRARAHEAIARYFRKAVKQLNPSLKLIGEADGYAQAVAPDRVDANLHARIRELRDEIDKLEAQNTSLLAQVLGDDQPVESDKVFTAYGEQFVSNLVQALDYDSIAVTAAEAAQ